MTDTFDENQIGREFSRARDKQKQLLKNLDTLVNSIGRDHVRWFMAISTGSLIWLITAVDRFTIENLLFWKWFYILIVLLQMFASAMFFYVSSVLFQISHRLMTVEVPEDLSELPDSNSEEVMADITRRLPKSSWTTSAEIAFLSSFVLLAVYIVAFIIQYR